MKLYVSNVSPSVEEHEIVSLFMPFGTVESVERVMRVQTNEPKDALLITMDEGSAFDDLLHTLNGYWLHDRRLFVSYARLLQPGIHLTPEEKQIAEEIADTLGETEKLPRYQIQLIVHICGETFARNLLEEARAVESQGGLLVNDGERRRTFGGVYFRLARNVLSPKLQRRIFYIHNQTKPRKKTPSNVPVPAAAPPKSEKAPLRLTVHSNRDRRPSYEPTPPRAPVAPLPVILPPDILEEYESLLRSHAEAEATLADIQAAPADKQAGLFSATKKVWQIKSKIEALIREYPELEAE